MPLLTNPTVTEIPQLAVPAHRLQIAGTVGESIVDGEGYRYTIFTQGCPHNCFGCHNPKKSFWREFKPVFCGIFSELGAERIEKVHHLPFAHSGILPHEHLHHRKK